MGDEGSAARRVLVGLDARAGARLRALVDDHFAFLWRSVRRLGVADPDVDDVTQQVFLTASRRLDEIPEGKERSFLFGVALRASANARRSQRRRSGLTASSVDEPPDPAPGPDDLADRQRLRALVDEVLEAMPIELRAVFVLFEVEEITMAEIAALLDLPAGTVASRLRRARQDFRQHVKRLQARGTARPGVPR